MAFKGKTALVTGGASGMGKISTLRLAKQGAAVAVLDMNEDNMKAVAAESDNIHCWKCDVADRAEVERVVAEVSEKLGPIDRLTHAAAIMPTETLAKMPVDDIIRIHDINYYGTVHMVKAVLPQMLERDSGDIIMFGSIAGYVLCPEMGAYSASKAAVNIFGEQLIRENASANLRILLVKPPATNTPLIDQALQSSSPAVLRHGVELGRFANPEHIVNAIEEGIEKNIGVLYPATEAKILTWMQKLAPKFTWNMTVRVGEKRDSLDAAKKD